MTQTRWVALRCLLLQGAMYGVGLGALAALLGSVFIHRGLPGALSGLNLAGLLLGVLAGSLISGATKSQAADSTARGRLGEATDRMQWPLTPVLVALVAAGVCFLLGWMGRFWV